MGSNSKRKSVVFDTSIFLQLSFYFVADPCSHYKILSDANRKSSYFTPKIGPVFCDSSLLEGWYRFVGAAGTKMPTTRVPSYRCGTDWSGWLDGDHPTVEDGEVHRKVCFSNRPSTTPLCRYSTKIYVKNCGSYFIYRLIAPHACHTRYCATDWIWSKKLKI